MINKLSLAALVAAIVAVTSPAFAQSSPDVAAGLTPPAAEHPMRKPARHIRHHAEPATFGVGPAAPYMQNSDTPEATGGGSLGYNENLYND